MADDDGFILTLADLEKGLRSSGFSRAVRRQAMADARAFSRMLVADGCSPDGVRYRAEVCEDCGKLSVFTFGVERRRPHLH